MSAAKNLDLSNASHAAIMLRGKTSDLKALLSLVTAMLEEAQDEEAQQENPNDGD